MKCEDYVAGFCTKKIKYKKYAEIIGCNKCCLDCKDKCLEICSIVKGGEYARFNDTDK